MLQPIEFKDFSGGFTDNYIGGALNKFQRGDNLLINDKKRPFSRPGSEIWDDDYYQIPDGAVRVGTLLPLRDDILLVHSRRSVFYVDGGWVKLLGPDGNEAFDQGGDTNYVTWSPWKKHTYFTNDAASASVASYVQKVYRDDSGALQLRTAGLPALRLDPNFNVDDKLASLITNVNLIRSVFLVHFAELLNGGLTVHAASDTAAINLVGPVATDEASLYVLLGSLLQAYQSHYKDSVSPTPTVHSIPAVGTNYEESTTVLPRTLLESLTVPTTLAEAADRMNDLHLKWQIHAGHSMVHGGIWGSNVFGIWGTYDYDVTYGPYFVRDYAVMVQAVEQLRVQTRAHKANQGATGVHKVFGGTIYNMSVTAYGSTLAQMATGIYAARISLTMHDGTYTEGTSMHWGVDADRLEDVPDPYQESPSVAYPIGDVYAAAPEGDIETQVDYLNELISKYNHHQNDLVPHNNLAANVNLNPVNGGEFAVGNYLYALHYAVTYKVGTVTYENVGPVTIIRAANVMAIENWPGTLQGIPEILSTPEQNYDAAAITVKIARTENGGTQFYYVGEVVNGTTTFTDIIPDEQLVTLEPLYISGGVADNDPPPQCKCMHICDGVPYYGNIVEDGVELPYRVRQGLKNNPDAAPGAHFVDLDDDVTMISSASSRVIAICKTRLYRLDGTFDSTGQGGILETSIHDSVGSECIQSAVQAEGGVFFAGTEGFYYTDGFQLIKINEDWPGTYAAITDTEAKRKLIQGTFHADERRIYWSCQMSDSSGDVDTLVVLDLRYGIRPDSTFTTWSNGSYFRPSAIQFFDKQFYRADTRGYVFRHDDDLTSDPRINTGAAASTWGTKAIVWDYISCAWDFGTSKGRKFIPSMQLVSKNTGSNLSIQPNSINDDKGISAAKALGQVRFRDTYDGLIREERWMPAGSLRCTYKQVQLTNANTVVTNSDTLGHGTTDRVLNTLTLDTGATTDWPTDAVDWYVCFPDKWDGAADVDDDYETQYLVTARAPDTLTLADTLDTIPAGSKDWLLKGVPKDESWELISYTLMVDVLAGGLDNAFQSGGQGANA